MALVLCTGAVASASCDKGDYRMFVQDARTARRSLVKAPALAQHGFEALDARARACLEIDKRPDAQFKLHLLRIGLQGYIGAARAQQGDRSGAAMVAQAQAEARDLLRSRSTTAAQRSLVQALLEQLTVPEDIVGRLRGH